MTVEEIMSYFEDHFFVERLTSKADNEELIKCFEAPSKGFKLGEYLHEKAWMDDLEGETKVYLIKDDKGFLVAFFSVKCGLLYDSHFCKNVHYEYDIDDMQGVSLGAGLFWKKIIPKVQEAITVVGCRYLYLFAADNSDYEEARSLIRYYKDDFKFDELQDLMIIKPDYDRRCQAMIQDVSEIERDEYTFWARYKKDN